MKSFTNRFGKLFEFYYLAIYGCSSLFFQEASALLEFQRALDCLVKGKNAAASKILKRLLNNPLVKGFNTTVFDWEAEVDERSVFGFSLRIGFIPCYTSWLTH